MAQTQHIQNIDSHETARTTCLWSCLFWSLRSLCLTGCAALRPAKVPLDVLRYAQPGAERPGCLLVFLPGRWDRAGQYETTHFIQAAQQAGVRADILPVEAHYGYYAKRTVVTRWREDVIAPALAQGYAQVRTAPVRLSAV